MITNLKFMQPFLIKKCDGRTFHRSHPSHRFFFKIRSGDYRLLINPAHTASEKPASAIASRPLRVSPPGVVTLSISA